jgi:alkyl hydroperoxide reductase subunit AhpC
MATLCLGSIDHSAPSLSDWMGEDWGLLFSHPLDFQDQGTEYDRWLGILRKEFRASRVRPLACRRPLGDADASWVGELTCDHRLIRLECADASGTDTRSEDVIHLAARALRDVILSQTSHYVLIIDPALQCRGVLKYSAGRTSVSPLDLLASVDAMRREFVPAKRRDNSRPVAAVA